MRPRRKILIIDVNEPQRRRTRYVLWLAGFNVQAVGSAAEARSIVATWDPDGVLAALPAPGVGLGKLLDDLHITNPRLPSLVLAKREDRELAELSATATAVNAPMCDVLDRLKTITARKRGPRKGWKKPVQVVAAADALAERRLA